MSGPRTSGAGVGGVGGVGGGVRIRDGVAADVPTLVSLIAGGAVGGAVPPDTDLTPYVEAMREVTGSPHSVVLVAELDRRVVGMVQLLAFRHLQQRGGLCGELESMHVATSVRGHGVGGLLLEAAVVRAREWGCYRLQLTSNDARPDAHRFYAAHGFTGSHRGFKRQLDA